VASTAHVCYARRCYEPTAGKISTQVNTPYPPRQLALDEPYLYMLMGGMPCVSIWRATTDGSKVEHFWDSPGNPSHFALDAEYVYWFDGADQTFYRKHK
jgi:hypothetical protein